MSHLQEQSLLSVNCGTDWQKNASIFEKDLPDVLCQPCKRAKSYLERQIKAVLSITPAQKAARLEPSSNCPLAALSPASQKEQKSNLMKERERDKKLLRMYEHTELTLDDDRSEEMGQIVGIINRSCSDSLQCVFKEAKEQGGKSEIEEIWKMDIRSDREQFNKDQATNGEK